MTYKETINDYDAFLDEDEKNRDHELSYSKAFQNDSVFMYIAHILHETNAHLKKIGNELEKLNKEKQL